VQSSTNSCRLSGLRLGGQQLGIGLLFGNLEGVYEILIADDQSLCRDDWVCPDSTFSTRDFSLPRQLQRTFL
jgi:hypothetical protein